MNEIKLISGAIMFFGLIITLIGIQKIFDDNSNIKQTGIAPLVVGILLTMVGLGILTKDYF